MVNKEIGDKIIFIDKDMKKMITLVLNSTIPTVKKHPKIYYQYATIKVALKFNKVDFIWNIYCGE